jgi:alpha-galactosidase/6-phospho-beta-glucosidase family protein
MGTRITIVGGGSYHWAPRLLSDFANTPALQDAAVVLHDIDATKLPRMVELGGLLARRRGIPMSVTAETDRRRALEGAEYVIACLSVGGFESMAHDLEIPESHGMRQPIGDTVGPGGVMRALRSVPVVVDIARDIEAVCPDALFINVSNPLTALCRGVTRETKVQTVGLCNELVGMQYVVSLLLDADMRKLDPVVGGVNHLPLVTELRDASGNDALVQLRDLLDDPERAARETMWMEPPAAMEYEKITLGERWHKADVIHNNRVRLELFRRFGVLPGSGDHHVAEFFPGFVTPENDFGSQWKVHIYGLSKHMADADDDVTHYEAVRDSDEVSRFPSGELVAPLIEALVTGAARDLPVNLPNRGQVANLRDGLVVEAMGTADGDGLRARDTVDVPSVLGEYLRRVAVSQELTVDAALTGDRTAVFEAMLADPMAGRLPYEEVATMTEEMLTATSRWLPQF